MTKRKTQDADGLPALYPEGVIFNESDIPAGYVPLGDLYKEDNRLHAFVLRACHENKVRRFRHKRSPQDGMAPIYINVDDLAALKAIFRQRSDVLRIEQRASEPQCQQPPKESFQEHSRSEEHAVDIRLSLTRCVAYLGDIYDVLETIARATEATAKAVEELATKPVSREQ
jgi:hypothetical protein